MTREDTWTRFKPEIILLYCQRCLEEAADLFIAAKATSRFAAKLVMMPCTSKVEESHLLKLLAEGADGVQVVGCPFQQCQRLLGNVRAEKRVEHVRGYLREIGLGAERLGMERGLHFSGLQLLLLAEKRAHAVRPLGPNPMKGEERP
jgi:coenzyme F420-reducing hydrogenase delta subunit